MDKLETRAAVFMPLTESTYCILISLIEPRHGYGIMQNVQAISGERINLAPGTLYGALTKLLEQGLIARSEAQDEADERRKTYALTEVGLRLAELETERLGELSRLGRDALARKGRRR